MMTRKNKNGVHRMLRDMRKNKVFISKSLYRYITDKTGFFKNKYYVPQPNWLTPDLYFLYVK